MCGALLMSPVMMLNFIYDERQDQGARKTADRIKQAYDQTLSDGQKTRDIGGELETENFADAVIERFNG